jgi:hypothetical protein
LPRQMVAAMNFLPADHTPGKVNLPRQDVQANSNSDAKACDSLDEIR